ncbi:probable glutamate receptor [Penaeus chinensis]|uniref:probable glutamate receptor n=1 Tax=Penaeus chinensis TaxID=139456 RepID=UPI001FB6D5DB|nr:probable glutamate receptor [Penaeus chinensis]
MPSPYILADIVDVVRNNSLESETLRWYVITDEDVSKTLIPVLREGTQVNTDTGPGVFSVVVNNTVSTNMKLFFVHISSLAKSSPIKGFGIKAFGPPFSFQLRGIWQGPDTDETLTQHDLIFLELSQIYADFKGRELVVSVINNWPFFGVKYLADGTPEADSGLDVSVLQALSRTLNFTYRLTEPEDRQWGGPQPDGSVTGMIGQVARHEAHLAINEITITGNAEIATMYHLKFILLSSIFLVVLQTWSLVALSTVTMGVLVWAMSSSSTSSSISEVFLETPPPSSTSTSSSFGLWQDSTFSAYRALVRQGSVVAPSSAFSLRLLLAIWYIFCYVIYAMYSGTLTAFLARPSFERPIDSLTDLIRASKDGFIPVFLAGSSNEFIFREATQGLFKEVWEVRDPMRSLSPTIDGGMDGVLSDKRVFINAKLSSVIRAAVRGSHRFYQATQTIYPQGYGVVCRSGAPYKTKFETVLARMVESGLVDKWTQDQVNQVRKTEQTYAGNDNRPKPITLYHLQILYPASWDLHLYRFGIIR